MTVEAVRDLITRMQQNYDPPPHLVMNARARSAVLADYENALAGFDAHTLDQAWRRVVAQHTRWTWPTSGELVKAAEFFSPRRHGQSDQEQRREQAQAMADAYTARFLEKFHLAQLARREGWLPLLKQYVEAAALVQAQLIHRVVHTGWDPYVLAPDQIGHGSSQELFDAYKATPPVANAVFRGQIRVDVPKARIQQWQQERRQQATEAAQQGREAS